MTRLNNSPIGFFDSGVGGVTVFEQVKKYCQMKIIFTLAIQKICRMEKKRRNNFWNLL